MTHAAALASSGHGEPTPSRGSEVAPRPQTREPAGGFPHRKSDGPPSRLGFTGRSSSPRKSFLGPVNPPRRPHPPAETPIVAYKLKLVYDGTNYSGWQRQPDRRTIQGTLEDAVFKITRQRVPVNGAGRTDAGVHALEQVAGFRLRPTLPDKSFFKALNAVLPPDIRVSSLAKAPAGFHPRKSARTKVYAYRILNAPRIDPFRLRYVCHWPHRLDLRAMRKAAALFEREADFSAFSSNRELHPVRTVLRSRLRRDGDEIVYTIQANGFLRYMVRTIVGTLLEIGRGRIPPEKVEELFREKGRTLHSPTAPAKGLCLMKVSYGPRTRPIT